jgi:hypothetical protein
MPKEDDAIQRVEYLLENISKSLDSIANIMHDISQMIRLTIESIDEGDEL